MKRQKASSMEHLEPEVKDRKKFDIDLQYGKVREQLIVDMLQDKKIEVKSERDIGDEVFATLVFPVESLKKIIDNLDYKKSVKGGDNFASQMYLLNIQKLFSSDVIKAFKKETDVFDKNTVCTK